MPDTEEAIHPQRACRSCVLGVGHHVSPREVQMMRTTAWWLQRGGRPAVVRLAAFFYDQMQAQSAFLGPLGAVVAQIEALLAAGYTLDDRPAPTRDMLCPDCEGWAGLPVPASQGK